MAQASFSSPGKTISGPCGLSIAIPPWIIGISIPFSIPFPPTLPKLNLFFKLSCDPTKPVTVTDGVPWGGGRVSNAPPDPDDAEWEPSY
jgi:hypothetical protein